MLEKIGGEPLDEGFLVVAEQGGGVEVGHVQRPGQAVEHRGDVGGAGLQVHVGVGQGGGEGRRGRVHAAHAAFVAGLAQLRPAAGVTEGGGVLAQQVGVEAGDHHGLGQVVVGPQGLAERVEGALGFGVAVQRFPGGPGGLGKLLEEGVAGGEGRGAALRFADHGDARPGGVEGLDEGAEGGVGAAPRVVVETKDRPRAVGVVHFEDGREGERVGRAAAKAAFGVARGVAGVGVQGAARHVDGAAVEAGDERAVGHAAALVHAGVLLGHAGQGAGGTGAVGEYFFRRPAAAAGEREAGEGHRRARELHELTPRHAQQLVGVVLRELAGDLLAERGAVGVFLEAAPVRAAAGLVVRTLRARGWLGVHGGGHAWWGGGGGDRGRRGVGVGHRWHVEQLCM